jgi:hypothetical protein
MMPAKKLPSRKYLLECFYYQELNGIFFWKMRPRKHFNSRAAWLCFNKKWAGKRAFTSANTSGHLFSRINLVKYSAHRVAWKIITGKDPILNPEHRDGDPSNNRWNNLRAATHAQNMANTKQFRINSTSGVKGVSFYQGRWRAYLNANKKRFWLGVFAKK